jgi:hypothetical protein
MIPLDDVIREQKLGQSIGKRTTDRAYADDQDKRCHLFRP